MEKTQNLLDYWYKLEFFSPYWPISDSETVIVSEFNKKPLPWIKEPNSNYTYDIYLGRVRTQSIIPEILKCIGKKDDIIDIDYSSSCICAFKVTGDGHYIESSFTVSTFVWAVANIMREKSLEAELNKSVLVGFNDTFDDQLSSIAKIGHKDLQEIQKNIFQILNIPGEYAFRAHINKKIKPEKVINLEDQSIDQSEDNVIDVNTDMMPSFYISDIDMIRRNIQPGDRVNKYIQARIKPVVNKVEIDTDINQMKKWLEPERYPLGKWPSINSPSLMQQIAINIAISNNPSPTNIFSINGPPGTGKTTLLKEIIASNVVERALLLCEYNNANDAFAEKQFAEANDKIKYFEPDPHLIKYGIIVASNNNAAVENISIELPLAKYIKQSNTALFNSDDNKEVYFSYIAKSLIDIDGEDCWGLISARLGKRKNIYKFKQALSFNKNDASLLKIFQGKIPNWEESKINFRNKYDEVIQYRRLIREAIDSFNKHEQIFEEYIFAQNNLNAAKSKMEESQNDINIKINHKLNLIGKIDTESLNLEIINKRISFVKKLLPFIFKNDPIIIKKTQTENNLDCLSIELTKINTEINDLEIKQNELNIEYDNKQILYEEKRQVFLHNKQEIEDYKNLFGNNFADDNFWLDISQNKKSQTACPWTNKKYDTLREELFYYALMLHKAFILNSSIIKHNISVLFDMWSNKLSEKTKAVAYSPLLNTLLFIVPVISTTFASVQTFLQYIDKEQLGLLIIDEAGQATPQSSLGALWRTQKAVIVGDPLQVEPFITVPKELCNKFAEELHIPSEYRAQELSVQVLADHIQPYGGYREYSDGKLWIGSPLVIHRRCLDPMFFISNKIAYNNRMFQNTHYPDEKQHLLLEKSVWLDIKGEEKGNKDHTVKQQTDEIIKMVIKAIEIQNALPSLFIISPFKSISNGLINTLHNVIPTYYPQYKIQKGILNNWINTSCGTVHTFQGKEANEVILVLGCDENGVAAADWAANKLNILNVAITRAKYRIAIIGDSNLWGKYPTFGLAYEALRE